MVVFLCFVTKFRVSFRLGSSSGEHSDRERAQLYNYQTLRFFLPQQAIRQLMPVYEYQ